MQTTPQPRQTATPPALVAVVVAARKSGDRDLERAAIRELRESHGLRLSWARPPKGAPRGK